MKKHILVSAALVSLLALLTFVLTSCGGEASPTPTLAPATPTLPATLPPATPTAAAPPAVSSPTQAAIASPSAQASDHIADAQRLVDMLAKEDYDGVEATFDSVMQQKLPAGVLRNTWQSLIQQAGAFKQRIGTPTSSKVQQYIVVVVPCQFEKMNIDAKITYDPDGKVGGLFFGPSQAATSEHVTDAQSLVSLLVAEDFAAVESRFDAVVQAQLPADGLRDTWQALIQQVGAFQQPVGTPTAARIDTGTPTASGEKQYNVLVTVPCRFEKASIDIRISYDPDGKVGGLVFAPSQAQAGPPPTYEPPKVDTSTFTEKTVEVGSGEWVLPGTLSIPNGAGPFPAVVLVHGSGPNDRDETIGPNKPFRDMAWGLASKGIIVLRYDKRSRVYAQKVAADKTLTVKDEVIDDAAAAVSLLVTTGTVDPKRVYVLGHSLGGYLIPRIGQAAPDVHGLISLAGPTRPLEDLLLEQYTYIFSLDGTISAQEQKQLDILKQQVARVKDPNLKPDTPASQLPLNIPASYWLDLRGYNPAEVAKGLKQPMLILQGESDYQVTMEDFRGWQGALGSRADVLLKSYPGLNHLFMPVQGKSTPENTLAQGHVSEQVIADIAGWINK